jgi:hypothetical protein
MKIDIALICGRRPELLRRTIASFNERVFRNFDVANCHVNIDPFGGTGEDGEACRALILERFPEARITMPAKPGFGQAVKTAWSSVTAPVVLHLEDDWICHENITPEQVFPLLEGRTKAVKLVCRELNWNGRDLFYERERRYKILKVKLWTSVASVFGTSPAFFDGDFMRRCAELMDPALDPEKQMRPPFNRPLVRYLDQFRCRLLPGNRHQNLIEDIGREWREEHGITKTVSEGRSVWTSHQ